MSQAARYFSRRRGLAGFIAAGPLAPVLDDLAIALEAKGYSTATVQVYVWCYLQIDATERLKVLAAVTPPALRPGKFRPPDRLIAALRGRPDYAEHTGSP